MQRWWIGIIALLLVTAACNSDPAAETTTLAPVTTTTEPPLQPALWAEANLVGIRSEGRFADAANAANAGSGTGIVLDTSGLILAPATAVVGADRVNVTISGVEFPVEATIEAVAECPNLALLTVDHAFEEAALTTGSVPAFAAWIDDLAWQISDPSLAPDLPGAVLADVDGAIVSMNLARGEPTSAEDLVALGAAMRRREITSQLGFAVVDGEDGGVLVTSIEDDAGLDLRPGDLISSVVDAPLTGGVEQLCASPPANGTAIEVIREGSRFEGIVGLEALHPGSYRTTEELLEAVVRIDIDVDGDGLRDGNGSGFFISSDGYVVTNHHVVSGASQVGVTWDGGQRTEQGTVVGRSSCADLAVIDLAGSDYQYLEWSQVSIALEQRVRAIGFPVGTDRITIQPGAVSKSTVDPFINSPTLPQFEHSAQIIGGNSGGPIVNENGEVVGVTNAGRELGAAQESLALVGQDASPVVDQLLGGDVDHIGAQLGPIFWGEGFAWAVQSVDPDSVAGEADLRRGDVIEQLGTYDASSDEWTLEAICDTVLSTSEPIPIEVARGYTDERLDGELRGRPLQRIPDPFVANSPDGVIGTVVPGRWVGFEPIVPDDQTDFRGFRAGLAGFDWLNQFGREPYMRALASLQLAADRTTEEQLASETYDGICANRSVFPSIIGDLIGHEQAWSDCTYGFEIVSFAWVDTSQSPAAMVLLLVIDDPADLAETVSQARDSLFVAPFPPPVVDEEGEG